MLLLEKSKFSRRAAMVAGISALLLPQIGRAQERQRISFGTVADLGPADFYQKAEAYGLTDHAVVFWNFGSDELLPVERSEYRPETDIVLVVQFPAMLGGVYKTILSGVVDDDIRAFANRLVQAGRPLTIRFFHEPNGNWDVWNAYHPTNDPRDYKPAYRKLVSMVREVTGDLVKFDVNFNRRSALNNGIGDIFWMYPGDEFADSVSISSYNRCGTSDNYPTQRSFAFEFRDAYRKLTSFTDRPIAVAETGTTDKCGTSYLSWYADMLIALREEFTQVEQVTFFFAEKGAGEASVTERTNWTPPRKDAAMFKGLINGFQEELLVIRPPARP